LLVPPVENYKANHPWKRGQQKRQKSKKGVRTLFRYAIAVFADSFPTALAAKLALSSPSAASSCHANLVSIWQAFRNTSSNAETIGSLAFYAIKITAVICSCCTKPANNTIVWFTPMC
jgi:hypothetical protein